MRQAAYHVTMNKCRNMIHPIMISPNNPLAPSYPRRRESSEIYTPQSGQNEPEFLTASFEERPNLDIAPLRGSFCELGKMPPIPANPNSINWIHAFAGMTNFRSNGHDEDATPDDKTRHALFPHLNPLPEGEDTNESLREFHVNRQSGINELLSTCHDYGDISMGKVLDLIQKIETNKNRVFDDDPYGFRVVIYKESEVGGVNEGANEGANEGVNALLALITHHPGLRAPLLADKMQTSVKNIERWLKNLKENGDIEFRGASKTGGYFAK